MNEGRGSSTVREAVSHFNAGLGLLDGQVVDGLDAVDLGADIERLQLVVNLLQLQSARRLRRFDSDGGFRAGAETSTVDWLRDHGRMSAGSALKQVRLARQLDDLESTVEAVETGQVGFEHALEVANATTDLGAESEAELLETAAVASPEEVRQAARVIRHRGDAPGLEDESERQRAKRRLRVWETSSGMTALEGELPAVGGQRLRLCLESLIGVPAKGDRRSQEQRQADALEDLCRRRLESGSLPRLGGRRPQVTIVVRAETLAGIAGSEPARLEGAGPLALSAVRELLGESALRLAVEGEGGVTLNYGRARRLHSDLQRLEMATRQETCSVERCTRKARQCEMHHPTGWRAGGGTDSDGELYCLRHHRMIESGEYQPFAAGGGRYRLKRIRAG